LAAVAAIVWVMSGRDDRLTAFARFAPPLGATLRDWRRRKSSTPSQEKKHER
jgi:hypothetical protein